MLVCISKCQCRKCKAHESQDAAPVWGPMEAGNPIQCCLTHWPQFHRVMAKFDEFPLVILLIERTKISDKHPLACRSAKMKCILRYFYSCSLIAWFPHHTWHSSYCDRVWKRVHCKNDPHGSLKDDSHLEEVYCKNDPHGSLKDDLVPVGHQEMKSGEGFILNSL